MQHGKSNIKTNLTKTHTTKINTINRKPKRWAPLGPSRYTIRVHAVSARGYPQVIVTMSQSNIKCISAKSLNTKACKYRFTELLIQIITTGLLIGTLIQLYESNSKNTRVAERLTNTYG